ncbi:hypothetical protein NM688_g1013 [Phlebia brevispora]|uniref:Uncharacterized protein n=1 Tax=Phlebia brevispora TaxID=194682 RepID=A0ACC1TCC9_9APHY|nr:hypothetical protein NM688_g1013 [Phlebia brevispora]
MPQDVEYTRKFALCRNFAAEGICSRPACAYSHTIIDSSRLHALVGETPVPSMFPGSPRSGNGGSQTEKTYFLIEYTKHSADSEAANPDATNWRMRLIGGGRATLSIGGAGETISVQPSYPVKGQGAKAGAALVALEGRVFGRSPQVSCLLFNPLLQTTLGSVAW